MATLITIALWGSVFAFAFAVWRIAECLNWREATVLGTFGAILVAGALFAGSFT